MHASLLPPTVDFADSYIHVYDSLDSEGEEDADEPVQPSARLTILWMPPLPPVGTLAGTERGLTVTLLPRQCRSQTAHGRGHGGVLCIVLLVQQMHMGKPSDAHGENFPHFPTRLHCLLLPAP